jgi:hypothetical protein
MQMNTLFHVLAHNHPMLKYETMFISLAVTFKAIQFTQYIDCFHHKVPIVDNGSWIYVHADVMFTLLEKIHFATSICD